jgi:hypothetical protein
VHTVADAVSLAKTSNVSDLERKPDNFRQYYNAYRVHTLLDGNTPSETSGETSMRRAALNQFR